MIAGVRLDIRELRGEVVALRGEVRQDIAALRGDVRQDIGEIRKDMGSLRTEMREFRAEMVRRFEQVDARFNWMLGLLFAIVLALVSAVLTLR